MSGPKLRDTPDRARRRGSVLPDVAQAAAAAGASRQRGREAANEAGDDAVRQGRRTREPPGLAAAAAQAGKQRHTVKEVEVRLSMVCYGGVSLAITMFGVTREYFNLALASRVFDAWKALGGDARDERALEELLAATTPELRNRLMQKLVRASKLHPTSAERRFLRELSAESLNEIAMYVRVIGAVFRDHHRHISVVVDMLAGTSAGGINAIALAKALALEKDLTVLRDFWVNRADVRLLNHDDSWASHIGGYFAALASHRTIKRSRRYSNKWFRSLFKVNKWTGGRLARYVFLCGLFIYFEYVQPFVQYGVSSVVAALSMLGLYIALHLTLAMPPGLSANRLLRNLLLFHDEAFSGEAMRKQIDKALTLLGQASIRDDAFASAADQSSQDSLLGSRAEYPELATGDSALDKAAAADVSAGIRQRRSLEPVIASSKAPLADSPRARRARRRHEKQEEEEVEEVDEGSSSATTVAMADDDSSGGSSRISPEAAAAVAAAAAAAAAEAAADDEVAGSNGIVVTRLTTAAAMKAAAASAADAHTADGKKEKDSDDDDDDDMDEGSDGSKGSSLVLDTVGDGTQRYAHLSHKARRQLQLEFRHHRHSGATLHHTFRVPDLFVTVTDSGGWHQAVKMPSALGRANDSGTNVRFEKHHEHVLEWRGDDRDAFLKDDMLAFGCRATSSFPIAFRHVELQYFLKQPKNKRRKAKKDKIWSQMTGASTAVSTAEGGIGVHHEHGKLEAQSTAVARAGGAGSASAQAAASALGAGDPGALDRATIDELVQQEFAKPIQRTDAELARFFFRNYELGAPAAAHDSVVAARNPFDTHFVDGGLLANKPFGPIVDRNSDPRTLRDGGAPVQRVLMYIEPDPNDVGRPFQFDKNAPKGISYLAFAAKVGLGILTAQTIQRELAALRDLNDEARRLEVLGALCVAMARSEGSAAYAEHKKIAEEACQAAVEQKKLKYDIFFEEWKECVSKPTGRGATRRRSMHCALPEDTAEDVVFDSERDHLFRTVVADALCCPNILHFPEESEQRAAMYMLFHRGKLARLTDRDKEDFAVFTPETQLQREVARALAEAPDLTQWRDGLVYFAHTSARQHARHVAEAGVRAIDAALRDPYVFAHKFSGSASSVKELQARVYRLRHYALHVFGSDSDSRFMMGKEMANFNFYEFERRQHKGLMRLYLAVAEYMSYVARKVAFPAMRLYFAELDGRDEHVAPKFDRYMAMLQFARFDKAYFVPSRGRAALFEHVAVTVGRIAPVDSRFFRMRPPPVEREDKQAVKRVIKWRDTYGSRQCPGPHLSQKAMSTDTLRSYFLVNGFDIARDVRLAQLKAALKRLDSKIERKREKGDKIGGHPGQAINKMVMVRLRMTCALAQRVLDGVYTFEDSEEGAAAGATAAAAGETVHARLELLPEVGSDGKTRRRRTLYEYAMEHDELGVDPDVDLPDTELMSSPVAHFQGFVDKVARRHDMLWGRLNGVETALGAIDLALRADRSHRATVSRIQEPHGSGADDDMREKSDRVTAMLNTYKGYAFRAVFDSEKRADELNHEKNPEDNVGEAPFCELPTIRLLDHYIKHTFKAFVPPQQ